MAEWWEAFTTSLKWATAIVASMTVVGVGVTFLIVVYQMSSYYLSAEKKEAPVPPREGKDGRHEGQSGRNAHEP